MAKKWNPNNTPDKQKAWDTDSPKLIDFIHLQKVLNDTGVQKENNSLFQVINGLLKNAQQNKELTVNQFDQIIQTVNSLSISINFINSLLANLTFLTSGDESSSLPNSREELPGTNITFDDSIPNRRTINATGGGGSGGSTGAQFPVDAFLDYDEPVNYNSAGGTQGATGATGAQGLQGVGGLDGIDGEDGWPGATIIGPTGLTGATGTAGIQPDVLIALCARLLRRIKFLEANEGMDYNTDDLPQDPTNDELITLELDGLIPTTRTVALVNSFGITVDGGGATINAGFKGIRRMPCSGIITSVYLDTGDNTVGSIVFDIYKGTTPLLTSANSIAVGNKPTINNGTSYNSAALNGISFNVGDVFGFNVDSISGFTRAVLTINVLYNQQLY